jgi:hypothetical protein
MEATHEITDQVIDDILTAAFEGGINYWCSRVRIKAGTVLGEPGRWASECVSRGATLELLDGEDEWHDLDRGAIERGIRQAATDNDLHVDVWYEGHDADDADVAVQLAIYGEVVYQ